MSESAAAARGREEAVASVGAAFLRVRPFLVAPAALMVVLVTWRSGSTARQQFHALVVLSITVLSFFGYEAWRSRHRAVTLQALARSLGLTIGFISLLCWLTGAIHSPLVPVFFAPVVVGLAAFGRSRTSVVLVALLAAALGVLAAGASSRPFSLYLPRQAAVMTLAAFALSLSLITTGVVALVDAHRRAGADLAASRAAALHQALDRTRDLETMGAKLAHEIRNPLVAIKGLVQLLSRGGNVARDPERFQVVLSEIDRLEQIVRDYLSFARPLEALRPAPVSLPALLSEVASAFEPQAASRNVALTQRSSPGSFLADDARLKQALLNLLMNALDATPAGGSIELLGSVSSAGTEISLRDSGHGMSQQDAERAGTPFFTTRSSGTGLGVAISRGIVEQHGGTLELASTPGHGTLVRLLIPPRVHREGAS